MDNEKFRPIRSFVKRMGRITKHQEHAFTELLPVYGLKRNSGFIQPDKIFARQAPLILEIGFGMGQSLLQMAANHPENDYIGIEVHEPGVGSLLGGVAEQQLTNLRVYCDDAVEILKQCIPDHSLTAIYIFFPDPWHKKRHHKRRLIQAEFVKLLQQKLLRGGQLHLATDWQDYAEHMLAVMSVAEGWQNQAGAGQFHPRPDYRPLTKFEQRGQRLGHGVWDLIFISA